MASTRRTTSKALRRYQLQVELADVTPLIWRTVWVEGDFHLGQLHHILQAAMGWTDAHLHEFQIGGKRYGNPDNDEFDELDIVDESAIQLSAVLKVGLEFEYQYDFGDSWVHRIRVKASKPLKQSYGAAVVEAGARACPPEDSGGAYGYQEFLDGLANNPKDDEVKSFLVWAGKDFDPNLFDRYAANAALLRMAWNAWGKE